MIGKILLALYVVSEMTLSYAYWVKGKKIILGDKHPIRSVLSLTISGAIWFSIFYFW